MTKLNDLEIAKMLFENNIPAKIIAKILDISNSKINEIKKNVEENFEITIKSTTNKNGWYGRLLEIYARNFFSESYGYGYHSKTYIEEILEIETIKGHILTIIEFNADLKFPKGMSVSERFKPYFDLLKIIINADLLGLEKRLEWKCNLVVKKTMENIMFSISNKEIDLSKVEDVKSFLPVMIRFLANTIDRDQITTLTFDEKKIISAINEAIGTLSEKEQEVLIAYCGLYNNKLDIKAIGIKIGLSEGRTLQIKENALKRMQRPSRNIIILREMKSVEKLKFLEEQTIQKQNETIH
jgi:hypothetical protein